MYDWDCTYQTNFNTLFSKIYPPVENFIIFIKRDPTLFPAFNISHYGTIGTETPLQPTAPRMLRTFFTETMFNQTLMTWTYSRGKKYMYLVFVKIVLTEKIKKIVREHQGDKYSQKVYAKLSADALKYTKALLNSSKLL